MSNNHRVLNLTRGFSMKFKQALRAIEECACEWVEQGVSVRDLTLAESVAKRAEVSRRREPLAFSELPWLKYQPPANENTYAFKRERNVILRETQQFAAGVR